MGNTSSKKRKKSKCKQCTKDASICQNESYIQFIDILNDVWLFDKNHEMIIVDHLETKLNISSYEFIIQTLKIHLPSKQYIDNKLQALDIKTVAHYNTDNSFDDIYHAYCHGNQYINNISPCINQLNYLEVDSKDNDKRTLKMFFWSERDGIGKSALFLRFITNNYVADHDQTINDSAQKRIVYENDKTQVKLQLYIEDCSGYHDGGDCLSGGQFSGKLYLLRYCDMVLLVYSIDNRESFEDIEISIKRIKRNKDEEQYPMIIVATKVDLRYSDEYEDKDKLITTEEGVKLAQQLNLPYIEVSAKDDRNVQFLFKQCIYEYCAMSK